MCVGVCMWWVCMGVEGSWNLDIDTPALPLLYRPEGRLVDTGPYAKGILAARGLGQ